MIRAVIFDIDGTLTISPSGNAWLELTKGLSADVDKHISLYEGVSSGKLTLDEAKEGLLNVWKTGGDITKSRVERIFKSIPLREGAEDTVSYLKDKGYVVCLITGSPDVFAGVVAEQLGIKHLFGNEFIWDEKGKLVTYEYDPAQDEKKLKQFDEFIDAQKLDPKECAIVGDGWNDNKLFTYTERGIAINPADKSDDLDERLERISWKVIDELHELRSIL